ncbi:hypothetical protein [Rhizobium lentis]|uniref:hypothetical protein n=1 Tax=Rhizobium lentis TaxID=1138194 RepID=UPI001A91E2C1|nr:hypothetical protein [Rhizobium lentis]MBX5063188.1 hypothetical protein [Rhizobium lentis]MBX5075293.1 hypothetical protein [Rhizobium lentis]QSW92956.1 hypothetical protein J0663_18005 [Rhizobium lentis]
MFRNSQIATNDHPELIVRHIEVARTDRDADAYTFLTDDLSYSSRCRGHDWRASPGTEVTNGATGEITRVPPPAFYRGGDITLSQLAERLGMGPRKTRATLASLGILHEELEAKMVPMVSDPMQKRPEYSSRLRLSEWAVKMRYGRRVVTGVGYDLDWITPAGLAYIDGMLSTDATAQTAPKKEPKAIEVIGRLLSADPTLRQVDIIRLTGLSKMTVHRNLRLLGKR